MSQVDSEEQDALTGVLAHGAFARALEQEVSEGTAAGRYGSLALVDMDRFMDLNQTHGHDVGDEVLRALARKLRESATDQGTVYRYAGDEFMVLLPGVEKERAFLLMEGIRKACECAHSLRAANRAVSLPLPVSVGIACWPDDGQKAQDVVRKACDALFRAKAAGANRVVLAREERMVTKTSHYTRGQLERLGQLAAKEGVGEAVLLREALDDLLRKYAS